MAGGVASDRGDNGLVEAAGGSEDGRTLGRGSGGGERERGFGGKAGEFALDALALGEDLEGKLRAEACDVVFTDAALGVLRVEAEEAFLCAHLFGGGGELGGVVGLLFNAFEEGDGVAEAAAACVEGGEFGFVLWGEWLFSGEEGGAIVEILEANGKGFLIGAGDGWVWVGGFGFPKLGDTSGGGGGLREEPCFGLGVIAAAEGDEAIGVDEASDEVGIGGGADGGLDDEADFGEEFDVLIAAARFVGDASGRSSGLTGPSTPVCVTGAAPAKVKARMKTALAVRLNLDMGLPSFVMDQVRWVLVSRRVKLLFPAI